MLDVSIEIGLFDDGEIGVPRMIEPLLGCEGVVGDRDLTRVTSGGGTLEFVDDDLLGEIFGFIDRLSDC